MGIKTTDEVSILLGHEVKDIVGRLTIKSYLAEEIAKGTVVLEPAIVVEESHVDSNGIIIVDKARLLEISIVPRR
jgi:hypothetical protein